MFVADRRDGPLSREGLTMERPSFSAETRFPMGASRERAEGSLSGHRVTRISPTVTDRTGHVLPGQGHMSSMPVFSSLFDSASVMMGPPPLITTGPSFVPVRGRTPVVLGTPIHSGTSAGRTGLGSFGITMLIIAAVCVIFPFMLVAIVA